MPANSSPPCAAAGIESILFATNEASLLHVYAMVGGGYLKIGISKDVLNRHAELQAGLPFLIQLVFCSPPLPAALAKKIERELLTHNAMYEGSRGEWFVLADKGPEAAQLVYDLFSEAFNSARPRK